MLRSCLLTDDGTRTVVVGTPLPLRSCDYALMVAESLPGGHANRRHRYSFGPFTPYERRDKARSDVLKKLFGVVWQLEYVEYTYIDQDGKDVSDEYRQSGGWP
ncbi:MAG: hypothetical protein ACYTBZ_16990 [Planctomycetota bacterium]